MTESDFPALYQDADSTAASVQKRFLFAAKAVIFGSLSAGFLSSFESSKVILIIQVLLALIALGASCFLLFFKPQKVWYSTRALAESVKTITWRYVIRAEPFDGSSQNASVKFRKAVSELLRANDEASALRYESVHRELITSSMTTIRESSLDHRRKYYLESRIDNQLSWYLKKRTWNDLRSKIWYWSLILSSFVSIILSIMAIDLQIDISVDWLFSLPIAILGWVQIKRYQELASSYSLTAHEITFAKNELVQKDTESKFAAFVADTENAFSREHTQWYARKDVA